MIEVILTLVNHHRATDDRVGSGQLSQSVSNLVFARFFEAAHDMLKISDASIVDVLVMVAFIGKEWVVDWSKGGAAMLQITICVNLHRMKTRFDSREFADENGVVHCFAINDFLLDCHGAG